MPKRNIKLFVKSFFVFFLCLCFFQIHSQIFPNYLIQSKSNGLQSSTVYDIHVAKNGLLYIAHSKGLSSYDGLSFRDYFNKDFPYTEITNIMETVDSTIFCKSFNNYIFRLGNNDSLSVENWLPTQTGFSFSSVYKNTIIGITNDRVIYYSPSQKKSKYTQIQNLPTATEYKNIIFSGYAKTEKVYGFVFVDSFFNCYFSKIDTNFFSKIHFSNGRVFMEQGIFPTKIIDYWNLKILNFNELSPNEKINNITYFDDKIWICTTDGIYYNQKNNSQFVKILNGFNVSKIVKTKDNVFIASTIGNGLVCIPNLKVVKLSNIPNKLNKIQGYRDKLIIGTQSGNTIIYDYHNQKIEKEFDGGLQKKVDVLIYDTNNNTLITSGITTIFYNKNSSFTHQIVLKDYCFTTKGIILASTNGLYYYTRQNDRPWWLQSENTLLKHQYLYHLPYIDEPIYSVVYDSLNDKFYFKTFQGIFELNQYDKKPKQLPELNCVLKDLVFYNHQLFLITKDKGILNWNGKEYLPAFQNVSNGIFYKAKVFQNKLWVLAEDGLYSYDLNKWIKYDNRYGIDADNISDFYITDDEIFLNNGENIIHFSSNIINEITINPSLIIRKVSNNINSKNILQNEGLPLLQNSICFDFDLINYSNGNNSHIAYSINNEGIIHLQNSSRQLLLNHLMPNKYEINFYIVQDNKTPKIPSYTFTFTIKPPFYKTWWFIALLVLVFISIVFLISQNILHRWQKEAKLKQAKLLLEKELDKSILSSIKAQMNPHFLFNALNTIQSYIYMNDKYNASIFISKFSDLTRSILDLSNKENISIEEEIKSLTLYLDLEKMRFEESFDYKIIVDKNINLNYVKIPTMLIQPYVENAIKHGLLHKKTDRRLIIKFEKEENKLIISIDDNGIGRVRSRELNKIKYKKHQSFAMEANSKRLEILKNKFNDISFHVIDKYSPLEEPIGTLVNITLPIKSFS